MGRREDNVGSGCREAAFIGVLARERKWTLAVAESCTGGGLGWALTDVPGSSEYFAGGVIAYSNAVKKELLGVPDDVLLRFGAVSAECAHAMADGARRLFSADLGVSVTGIAGPTGATANKPVGLVFVGLARPGWCAVREFRFSGNRSDVREAAVRAALSLILEKLTTDGD